MRLLSTRSPEEPYLVERGPGYFEYQLPVSLKAVISWQGRLPVLRNERDEWELPGGKLEPGEEPAACLSREIQEELAWDAVIGGSFHSWVYRVHVGAENFPVSLAPTWESFRSNQAR